MEAASSGDGTGGAQRASLAKMVLYDSTHLAISSNAAALWMFDPEMIRQ